MPAPIRVAVTGAAGNIGYSLLWRIASGSCFGPDQEIHLGLLEITPAMDKLNGVIMELKDSAFPLLGDIKGTDDPGEAFSGADAIFLVGSRPRSKDMDRSDLVAANGPIFVGQGQAINEHANRTVKVVTVGNPCNTNCLIANANAPGIPDAGFSAMTRLDQNRAVAQIADETKAGVRFIHDVFVWGNHSNTMYPDTQLARIGDNPISTYQLDAWLKGDFKQTVSTRGKAIIVARGASSAASAASAAVDHMRDWWHGTGKRVVSMAIPSQGWYGVPEGLVFSFPVRIDSGRNVHVVEGLTIDAYTQARLDENIAALQEEKAAVANLLG